MGSDVPGGVAHSKPLIIIVRVTWELGTPIVSETRKRGSRPLIP